MSKTVQITFSDIYSNLTSQLDKSEIFMNKFENIYDYYNPE